jgi:hypothetical protein
VSRSEYQPDFDHDFRRGKVGEDLVDSFLNAVEGSTLETKTDYRAWDTGNLYIETQQEIRGEWVDSGLAISKSDFYCFAGPTGSGFVSIRTQDLVDLVLRTGRKVHMARSSPTSRDTRGFLIKVTDVVERIFRSDRADNN